MSPIEEFEATYVKPKVGRTLIVGSRIYSDREDRRKRYADALGVDMLDGPGVDRVLNLEEPLPADLGEFDHVECCSVLEHSPRPWLLAANLERLLVPGGTLYIAVPFVWRIHAYPSDFFRFTPEGVKALFSCIDWQAIKLGADKLRDGPKIKAVKVDDLPYLARTETLAFGVRW